MSTEQQEWVAVFAAIREAISVRLSGADPLGSEEIRDLADAATNAIYGHKMALCFDRSVEANRARPPE